MQIIQIPFKLTTPLFAALSIFQTDCEAVKQFNGYKFGEKITDISSGHTFVFCVDC